MNTSGLPLVASRARGAKTSRVTRPAAAWASPCDRVVPGRLLTCLKGGLSYRDALAQHRQKRLDPAAVALDNRGELIPLRHFHADTRDIDVADLGGSAALDDIPVDQNSAAARAVDHARHDRLVAARPAAEHAKRFAAIFAELRGIGLHDVFLEESEKLLLLILSCGAPIAAEHELADPRYIEIALEQLSKASDALLLGDARPQHLDRLFAEGSDEALRVLSNGLAGG